MWGNIMTEKRLKVGVIGCGAIAQRRHLPEYIARADVEVIAVCDFHLSRAQEVAEMFGVRKIYDQHEELLANNDIEAVSVCTPNHLHAAVSIEAMKAGKHVLCEKPMATTIKDAEAMVRAAKENGVFLMIGHNQRLMPVHQKAKQVLQEGSLGKVLSFQTVFGHSGPENWSVDGEKSWFFQKEAAIVGAMGDLGVHKADLIRWLLADEITEVSAVYGSLHKTAAVDDHAILLLKTQKGALGTLTASWTFYPNEVNHTLMYCEKGTLKIGTDPEFGVIVEHLDGRREQYHLDKVQTNESDGQTNSGVIDHFVEGVLSKKGPEINGEEGLKALKVIVSAIEAADRSTGVKIIN
jgi:UDP-N-acetylglucosamine 3-dehydrogenase